MPEDVMSDVGVATFILVENLFFLSIIKRYLEVVVSCCEEAHELYVPLFIVTKRES